MSVTTFVPFTTCKELDVYKCLGMEKPSFLFRTLSEQLEESMEQDKKEQEMKKQLEESMKELEVKKEMNKRMKKEIEKLEKQKRVLVDQLVEIEDQLFKLKS
jgi:septal ring factor EnvC (AmiA/AmiB activator)